MKRNRTSYYAVMIYAMKKSVEYQINLATRKEKRGCTVFTWEDNKPPKTHRFYSYSKALEFLKGIKKETEK